MFKQINNTRISELFQLIFEGQKDEGSALDMYAQSSQFDSESDNSLLVAMLGRVRLRTLILLRWLAITGQTLCVVIVHYGLGFDLPMGPCFGAIAASAWVNVWLSWFQPTQRFAKDWEAFAQLAYDAVQLMVLLALTGGLLNPFSVMLMGPVVIAVAALPARWWLSLAGLVIGGSVALATWHLPLPWYADAPLVLPPLFQIGIWIALVIAVGFTAIYAWRIGLEARRMGMALAATQTVLAQEQRLSAIGALAAAAAHELGTPLATIQLTAKEMQRESQDDIMREDAALIVSQAQRCREILKRLSETRDARDQMHERIGLADLIEEAIAPLRGVGAAISVDLKGGGDAPTLVRRTELIYALGNFVENAVDFANVQVNVTGSWNDEQIVIAVLDDGSGFSPDILSKLGEPYISTRQAEPGYGGLGLGVFIAITLTERVGGRVEFSNLTNSGARVELVIPRKAIEASAYAGPAFEPDMSQAAQ